MAKEQNIGGVMNRPYSNENPSDILDWGKGITSSGQCEPKGDFYHAKDGKSYYMGSDQFKAGIEFGEWLSKQCLATQEVYERVLERLDNPETLEQRHEIAKTQYEIDMLKAKAGEL